MFQGSTTCDITKGFYPSQKYLPAYYKGGAADFTGGCVQENPLLPDIVSADHNPWSMYNGQYICTGCMNTNSDNCDFQSGSTISSGDTTSCANNSCGSGSCYGWDTQYASGNSGPCYQETGYGPTDSTTDSTSCDTRYNFGAITMNCEAVGDNNNTLQNIPQDVNGANMKLAGWDQYAIYTGDINNYGSCGVAGGSHNYWRRDWDVAMNMHQNDISAGTASDRGLKCCSGVTDSSDGINFNWWDNSTGSVNQNSTRYCNPEYWAGSQKCTDFMIPYCSNSDNWTSASDDYCYNYLLNPDTPEYSKRVTIQNSLNDFLNKTNNFDNVTWQNLPNNQNSYLQRIIQMCGDNKGLCDDTLRKGCGKSTTMTLSNLSNQVNNGNYYPLQLCGCFMNSNQYSLPGILPLECNTVCSMNQNNFQFPLYNGTGNNSSSATSYVVDNFKGNPVNNLVGVPTTVFNESCNTYESPLCTQSTCAISDLTVNILNSDIGAGSTMQQLCGSCSSGTTKNSSISECRKHSINGGGISKPATSNVCTCIMKDIDISIINSTASSLNIPQICNFCIQENEGIQEIVDCSTGLPVEYFQYVGDNSENGSTYVWLFIILVVILLVWWLVR